MAKNELSSKQLKVQATNLLRGIDNNSVELSQKTEKLKAILPQTIAALEASEKRVKAAEAEARTAKAQAKTAKKPVAKKTAAGPKPKKAAKPAGAVKTAPKPAGERPPLKNVIDEVVPTIESGKTTAAAIRHAAHAKYAAKYGKWSNQSLYNALKSLVEAGRYKKTGEGAAAFFTPVGQPAKPAAAKPAPAAGAPAGEQDPAETFVEQVEANTATASVG